MKKRLLVGIAVFFCVALGFIIFRVLNSRQNADLAVDQSFAVSALHQDIQARLQPGDFILRTTPDYISRWIVNNLNGGKLKVSHVGVVRKHKNQWFVIHIIGDSFGNRIRADLLENFLFDAALESLHVVRLKRPQNQGKQIVSRALYYLDRKVLFDYAMDTQNDSKLYCSELIYHAVKSVTTEDVFRFQSLGNKQVISFFSFFNDKYFVRVWP